MDMYIVRRVYHGLNCKLQYSYVAVYCWTNIHVCTYICTHQYYMFVHMYVRHMCNFRRRTLAYEKSHDFNDIQALYSCLEVVACAMTSHAINHDVIMTHCIDTILITACISWYSICVKMVECKYYWTMCYWQKCCAMQTIYSKQHP